MSTYFIFYSREDSRDPVSHIVKAATEKTAKKILTKYLEYEGNYDLEEIAFAVEDYGVQEFYGDILTNLKVDKLNGNS